MGCATSCQTKKQQTSNNVTVSYPVPVNYYPNVLLDWEAVKKTEKYHLWPLNDK